MQFRKIEYSGDTQLVQIVHEVDAAVAAKDPPVLSLEGLQSSHVDVPPGDAEPAKQISQVGGSGDHSGPPHTVVTAKFDEIPLPGLHAV